MGLRSPSELLGLYQGVPYDRRGFYYGNVLPDKITLFKNPIEAICKTKEELEEKVKEVIRRVIEFRRCIFNPSIPIE
jgi:predicted Zn-dependent protease with MMP-like domain